MTNRLAGETSPYLLQHADNPVHWQPWGEAALAQARAENKPILLSIGYSACHWCHVMAHESFEDPEVAAVMNRLFVNIKVDREERPDLDQIYQLVHQMLTQRAGGWPLTMFLTPDGTPYFGGTYFPKTPRYQLPGFPDLCEKVAAVYAQQGDKIAAQSQQIRAALDSTIPTPEILGSPVAVLDRTPITALRSYLLRVFDPHNGGFGSAPKFPHPTDLAFLLRRACLERDSEAGHAVLHTLRCMANGGIYDQIGGGFSRYSVDERWEIPHFEKMLYDNGPLLTLYSDAWLLSGEQRFATVVEETATWVMREMQSPQGGYYSALDADSEGEEGKFYVWDRREVRALLDTDEWRVASAHWGMESTPNFERHWHCKVDQPLPSEDASLLASARSKLFAARELRIHPGRDDKILTSWNALMIAGMARAAHIFGRDDWLQSARRAMDFVRTTLWQDGRLLATCKNGKAHLNAYLDDYAFLLDALLVLMQAGFRQTDLDFARALAEALLEHFEDKEAGGFFFTSHDHEALIHRPKPGSDNATPGGNGVAALALQRLGHVLGEPRYLAAAEGTLRLFAPGMHESPAGCATLTLALEEALTPPSVLILRGPASDLPAWQQVLRRTLWPQGLTLALANELDGLPAALDKPVSNAVNAWLCSGVNCLPPIDTLDALFATLGVPVRNPRETL